MAINDLATIDASKENWSIVAKVNCLWLNHSLYGSKLPFSMDMILMDEKGCKIHASVRKTLIYRFQSLLSEGRVYQISIIAPGMGENYSMRVLLNRQKGCDNVKSIRTVKGVVYPTFRNACEAMRLMEDDREYVDGISIASELGSGSQLRKLFTRMLMTNLISRPQEVWRKSWTLLSDGILYERRKSLNILEQEIVYKNVLDAVLSDNGGFFFLYGFGGSGKTFVWNTLSAALRSRGLIVLNVASSGIASLLLPGGRTAHSRSLNDIMKTQSTHGYDIPFGGKVVVLGGDFRQILPVISKGSRSEIFGSAINSSYLWKHCKVMKLIVNMRLQNATSTSSAKEIKEFPDWLLQVGDGTAKTIGEEETLIEIHPDLLIEQCKEPLLELVNFAYPNLAHNLQKKSFFQERAIFAPTLECVEEINNFMLAMIPGDETEYLSCDTPCKSDEDSGVNAEWFTSEFLNDFKCSGIPNHAIKLKVGVPIMLIRNIYQGAGLCNGTRMIVNALTKYIIVATILNGNKSRV
ncbi:uncharacterized protein LOC130725335 [Lotus japonicus]|uniref:uncharacterized protein LOC130725335 n=1 Tax=Lotus japonicus TaxID=34305 RepID=UPI002589E49E|nr:uncharacterized protein LOC130725335 [Lotus japonicus]